MTVWLAAIAAAVAVLAAVNVGLGSRRIKRAADLPDLEDPGAPLVSIVVAARNEARGIEAGLRSLLDQRYPALELVVVDDRSTDGTGAIVDRLAQADPRIVPVHLDLLPDGWLGKNHAHWVGARAARGDWLLFTDADIVMGPETVGRVIRYALERNLDHVPMTPRLELPGPILEAFGVVFIFFFCLFLQPWRAADPKSRFFVGVGAFNLVRRSAYERAGTHRRIALRPDDDVKLGKILKRSGGRQELLDGSALIGVRWYHSLGELIVGLEKNTFAGLEYSVLATVAAVASHAALIFGPLVGVLLAGGAARVLSFLAIGITLATLMRAAKELGVPASRGLWYPVAVLLLDYIVIRTMVKNLADGGLRWRDTFYPLHRLKGNRV